MNVFMTLRVIILWLSFWDQQKFPGESPSNNAIRGLSGISSVSLTDQDFGGWIVDPDGLQDGGSVVGDRHRPAFPSTQQNLILNDRSRREWRSSRRPSMKTKRVFITHHPLGSEGALHQVSDGDRSHEWRLKPEGQRSSSVQGFSEWNWNEQLKLNSPVELFLPFLHRLLIWRCWPGPSIGTPANKHHELHSRRIQQRRVRLWTVPALQEQSFTNLT